MAERYWDGSTSTDPTDVNNWSDTDGGGTPASSLPGSGDHGHFTANGDGNACTLTAAWTLGQITVEAGYTSKIDLATFNFTVEGDATLNGGGEFDCGSGDHSVGGHLDYSSVGTWTYGTAQITLTGTAKNLIQKGYIYDLIIDGSITRSASSADTLLVYHGLTINQSKSLAIDYVGTYVRNTCATITVNGALSINAGKSMTWVDTDGNFDVGANGSVTGDGSIDFRGGTFTNLGTWDIASTDFRRTTTLGPGTYGGAVLFENDSDADHTLTLSAGTIIFNGSGITIDADRVGRTFTVANNANDPTIELHGDLTVSESNGTIAWNKGTGAIDLKGTANQSIDFNGETVEDLDLSSKADGTLTFTGDWTAVSLAA